MIRRNPAERSRRVAAFLVLAAVALVTACAAPKASKEEVEAARNTIVCKLDGERLMIRLDVGEVRLLMPDGTRVNLYQISSDSGLRYTNGMMELRGKDLNLSLIRNGELTRLEDCKQYELPKPQ
jgi:membrane-bound inhibitor of C-type lysozyme